MLRNNYTQYYYEDDYMFFTFAGIYSKKYNLFVVNEKKGYEWYASAGASSKFETPLYQNRAYYSGTSRSQKQMQLKVAAEGLIDQQITEMLEWLEEGKTGFLVVDWNKNWGYDVVIDKIANPTQLGNGRKSVIEFTITFKTIGDFRARSRWDVSISDDDCIQETWINSSSVFSRDLREDSIANMYGIPEIGNIEYSNSKNEKEENIYIRNLILPTVGNAYSYLDCDFMVSNSSTGATVENFVIKKNSLPSITYINYNFNRETYDRIINYNGASNFLIYNNQIVENVENLLHNDAISLLNFQNSNLLRLTGIAPKIVQMQEQKPMKFDEINNTITIFLADDVYADIQDIDWYISLSVERDNIEYNRYSGNGYNNVLDPYERFHNIFVYRNDETLGYELDENEHKIILKLNDLNLNSITETIDESGSITITTNKTLTAANFKNKPLFLYYGSYNKLQFSINNTEGMTFAIYKYNNL